MTTDLFYLALTDLLPPLNPSIRCQLRKIGGENPQLALAQRRRDIVGPIDFRRRIDPMRFRRDERGLSAQYLRLRGGEFGARPLGFGLGRRAVELDQNVAALTSEPLATRMASTLPVSIGSITLTRPVGWNLPCAAAIMSIRPK